MSCHALNGLSDGCKEARSVFILLAVKDNEIVIICQVMSCHVKALGSVPGLGPFSQKDSSVPSSRQLNPSTEENRYRP